MKDYIAVEKNEDRELPIPTAWREKISEIVQLVPFKGKSINLPYLSPISSDDATRIFRTISSYGGPIDSVSFLTWETSIYLWMDGYWDVLVDLSSGGSRIDLVLFLKVTESDGDYKFHVESVHVP